jgi:hypothetical protein
MIIPTLIISIVNAYRTRKMASVLCHILAISLWIFVNSYLMLTEFIGIDEEVVFNSVNYKHLALIPFLMDVLFLGYYYFYWRIKNPEESATM